MWWSTVFNSQPSVAPTPGGPIAGQSWTCYHRLPGKKGSERSSPNKIYLTRDGDRRWPVIARNLTATMRGAFWSALWLRSTPAFRWSNSLRAGFELGVQGAGDNMTDEVIPHFHNDLGVQVIKIGTKKFMCMGALPPQDHPHVFCDMGEDVEYVCPD